MGQNGAVEVFVPSYMRGWWGGEYYQANSETSAVEWTSKRFESLWKAWAPSHNYRNVQPVTCESPVDVKLLCAGSPRWIHLTFPVEWRAGLAVNWTDYTVSNFDPAAGVMCPRPYTKVILCKVDFEWNYTGTDWVPWNAYPMAWINGSSYKVKLSFPADIPPSFPNDRFASPIFVQTLNENGEPVGNLRVTVNVEPESNTGGHTHNDQRPSGSLSEEPCTTCTDTTVTITTNENGVGTIYFLPPEVSGRHRFDATCSETCDHEGEKTILVKVPGLVSLGGSADYQLVGDTATHPDNHYVKPAIAGRLSAIAAAYHRQFPANSVVRYNDASLQWGGLFDVNSTWQPPHSLHREGKTVDVRANGQVDAIPATAFEDFQRIVQENLCRAAIHSEGEPNQHFHIDCY